MKKYIQFNIGLFLTFLFFILIIHPENKQKIDTVKQQETEYIRTVNYLSQKECLTEALYFEARNTTEKERFIIAEVLLNRVKHKNYPKTICEVVFQPYQFSYRNLYIGYNHIILPKKSDIYSKVDQKALSNIEKIVDKVLSQDKNTFIADNVLFYHTKDINKKPKWSESPKKKKIHLDKGMKHVYYALLK